MALMRPMLSEAQLRALPSQAEAKFYRACRDQLSDDVLVIHSATWVYKSRDGALQEGEADFTLAFASGGLLTIEVKGGGVAFDAKDGVWSSIDRHGNRHQIKDPMRQASKERFAILDQVKGHPKWRRWPGNKFVSGHGVFFPDVEDTKALVSAERPKEIVGGHGDLTQISGWMGRANEFWSNAEGTQPLGPMGLQLVDEILCGSIEVRPILRSALQDVETERIRLTELQARILRVIGGRRRAVIAGGAGTGKTLIAVEKARQLAGNGNRVLFLCYNRPLADRLATVSRETPLIEVMSFHQFCERRVAQAKSLMGRDLFAEAASAYPGSSAKQKYEVQMPFALALSNEILQDRYDAIVVDEAQDFSDEYWFAIEELLLDPDEGSFYLFNDPNQALYKRHANLPVDEEPFYLTANCRNTQPIHTTAYAFYKGEPVDHPELIGPSVEKLIRETTTDQAKAIESRCRQLLLKEGVAPSDIVVLLANKPKVELYELLNRSHLPSGVEWAFETPGRSKAILVDTVKRFKGLEAAIVVLWLGDDIVDEEQRETLYVGTSRAKSMLCIVGSMIACSVLK